MGLRGCFTVVGLEELTPFEVRDGFCPPIHPPAPAALARHFTEGIPLGLGQGQTLHHFADPFSHVYLVEEGEIAGMIVTGSGATRVIHLARAGSIIGEMFAFAQPPLPALGCLVATRETKLRALPVTRVRQLFADDPEFASELATSVSRKAVAYAKQLEDLCFRGVRRRLAGLLVALFDAGKGSKVCHFSQEALAEMISAHRVTVTQALDELQGIGVIGVGRRRIFLLDRKRLLEEAAATDR